MRVSADKDGGVALNQPVRCLLFLALILGVATATQGQARILKSYRLGGVSYVAVRDLAEYYDLGRNNSRDADRAEYRTSFAQLSLTAEGRDITLNNVQHWLSIPVLNARNQLWISSLDVLKTIDPVLREGRNPNKSAIRTVVLDPGHGGTDRGTRGDVGREKELTLDTARRVERYLEAAGIRVIPTRTSDETVSLQERVEFMERKHPDLFVSIHFNSGGSATGIETYCVPPAGASSTANPFRRLFGSVDDGTCSGNKSDERNVWLAHCVQKSTLKATGANDRGVRRARFYVLRYATCPAILIEGGFLSNRGEEQRLLSNEYRNRLAKAIADGILDYRKTTE